MTAFPPFQAYTTAQFKTSCLVIKWEELPALIGLISPF